MTLYQLTGSYLQLVQKLSESDLDAQTVADTIEASGITDEIAVKAQGLEMVARNLEQHNPAIDAEIERLSALKKQRANTAKGLRDYLKSQMQAMQITKIECPFFKVALQNNPPSVDLYDAGMVPVEFMVYPEAPPAHPDKKKIAAAIKSGREVPGARLNQGQRLAIS